jgi:hypothetical protein
VGSGSSIEPRPFQRLLWRVYPRFYDRVWDNPLTDHLAARVVGLIPPGLPVDDVGAGTGLYTLHLHQAGMNVCAFEPDARMRRYLAARLPGLAVCDSAIEELSGGGAEPRVVVAANVLHLIPDPGAALEKLRCRAGRNGLVIVVGPSSRASLTRFCLALRRRNESVIGMLRFLSIHMLLAPLIALGGGLRLGRSSARLVDDATMEVTVDGVAQLALFEGQSWDGPFIQ